ncbi:MAG: hypothetical protein AAGF11_13430 [Myxococcota bacterium]
MGDPTGDPTGLDSTGTDGSTGEPAGMEPTPCDPEAEEPCDQGECAGSPLGGTYCRPGCSSSAEPGTPCGADDVCLPVAPGRTDTACYDVAECNVVTGEGCNLDAGEQCVVVSLDPLYTACVPGGDAGVGQACEPVGMLDCGSGLTCLGSDPEAGIDGQCTPWCEPGGALPDDCPVCLALGDSIGICSECGVLDDACPDGTQCQLANELLGGACVGVGDGGLGAPCSALDEGQSCLEGLLCVELGVEEVEGAVCIEPCDPIRPACTIEGQSCLDLSALDPGVPSGQLGVCLDAGVTLCDPMLEPSTCAPGDNCLDVGDGIGICGATCDPAQGAMACEGNFACFPSDGSQISFGPFVEGNGACGVGCTTDAECGGATCLHLDGLAAQGVCGATCTPGMPGTCGVGQACVATPEDPMVGACVAGGNNCNPTNLGDCAGGACIPLEGEALIGICMPSCFEQDPIACGGMPAQCISKTDPFWHEGTCVGGGEPCSLVEDDCGPGQACEILGGSAFGGQALLCDDAGLLGEGDACTPDDDQCGAGVGCIGGVCRAWCDPLAPACAVGVCTDVSVGFYLPTNTLGVCL